MTHTESWKPLAWNGVSVRVPMGWDPAELHAYALRASGDEGPALDLKWHRVGDRFAPEQRLDRLGKELGSGSIVDVTPQALPRGWSQVAPTLAEHGLETLPYSWHTATGAHGAGAVIFNPGTGIAALARFEFRQPQASADADTALTILETYRDHGTEALVPWAAFGIRALVPGSLELRSFSFTPGHFRLSFAGGKAHSACELVLDRLGPADVLLGRKTLAQYADVFYGAMGTLPGFFDEAEDGPDMARGELMAPAPLMARLLGRSCFPARQGRMWRAGIGAILLGAFIRARRAKSLEPFAAICDAYTLART